MSEKKEMKVLFVCSGNTCRSVMAEGIAREYWVNRSRLPIQVSSAGIQAVAGEMASFNAIQILMQDGIDLAFHKSRQIDEAIFGEADLILVMNSQHKVYLQENFAGEDKKILLLKSFLDLDDPEISDPNGSDLESYWKCAKEIADCVAVLGQGLAANFEDEES